jgi:ribosomal subunit interface protein
MKLKLRVTNADITQLLRSYVDRRLRLALSHFGDRIGNVSVTVHGMKNSSGESECRITTEVLPFGQFTVDEQGPELFAALDRAVGRIGRRIGRELDRVRRSRFKRESIRFANAA